jgi:3-oxoacyl-[acyl-carrier protein] reductase
MNQRLGRATAIPQQRQIAKPIVKPGEAGFLVHTPESSADRRECRGMRGSSMGKLDGKVAIVTGAARGLGRAYAKRLAGLGARVAVADLNLHSYEEFEAEAKDMTGESTAAEIEAMGGTAMGIEADVTDHEAVDAMVARVIQEWGQIDVLVANAGGGRGRPMDTKASTLDPALLRLVVEMNLFGTVYTVNASRR